MIDKEELSESLNLTPDQEKAFNKLQKSLLQCEKLNIKLVALEEFHYAFNGNNLLSHRDVGIYDKIEENEIMLSELSLDTPCIILDEPYVNVSVALKVKI